MATPIVIESETNKYTVDTHFEGKLYSGRFRDVYSATNQLDEEVAAKYIKEIDAELTKRLMEVKDPLLNLKHRNVVKVLDVKITLDGRNNPKAAWIMMELCPDGTLTEYLKRKWKKEEKQSLDQKTDIFIMVAKGIEYLHDNGVTHRDIKPDNILMKGKIPKIVDFDTCKVQDEGVDTTMHSEVGTPAFRAPEFFLKDEEDGLSYHQSVDIFSLGLTILGTLQFDEKKMKHIVPKLETTTDKVKLYIGQIIALEVYKTQVTTKETNYTKVVLIIVGCIVLGAAAFTFGGIFFLVQTGLSVLVAGVVGAGAGVVVGAGVGGITSYMLNNTFIQEFVDQPFNKGDDDGSTKAKKKRAALRKLIQSMAGPKPEDRPTARTVLAKLIKIRQI